MELSSFLDALWPLFQVIVIDVALAGDNAIVVGMAAAGLPAEQRKKAIFIGILAAAGLRIVFALFTMQLLKIVGLMVAGGVLLLWVSWKLWREIQEGRETREAEGEAALEGQNVPEQPTKTFRQAVTQIVLADVSMSLDNVLAVAGAADDHTWVLVVGLALSVALMGLAANLVARLLQRHHWIAYLGLVVILYVSIAMIWEGGHQVIQVVEAGGFR
jgi:YjbE family integral membrane protein